MSGYSSSRSSYGGSSQGSVVDSYYSYGSSAATGGSVSSSEATPDFVLNEGEWDLGVVVIGCTEAMAEQSVDDESVTEIERAAALAIAFGAICRERQVSWDLFILGHSWIHYHNPTNKQVLGVQEFPLRSHTDALRSKNKLVEYLQLVRQMPTLSRVKMVWFFANDEHSRFDLKFLRRVSKKTLQTNEIRPGIL